MLSSCWWKEWALGGCERGGSGLLHEAYFSAPPEGSELPGAPEIALSALSLPSWTEALNTRCKGCEYLRLKVGGNEYDTVCRAGTWGMLQRW